MRKRPEITRYAPLLDYEIARSGDGRTVIAYAATFGNAYEVRDEHGHYDEIINRAAFNKVLARPDAIKRVQVYFNHGMTLWGTPSDRWSEPIGVPEEITPDGRGLLTRTRYGKTENAEQVLQMWIDGTVRAQSFVGALGPTVTRTPRGTNGRPVLERMQLGLREYGPAPAVVNVDAELVSIRSQSQLLGRPPSELTPEERRELHALLTELEELEPDPHADPATAPALEPPADAHDPGLSFQEVLEAEQAQRHRR